MSTGSPEQPAQAVQIDIFARSSLTAEEAREYLQTVDPQEREATQAALNYRFRMFGCQKCSWSQAGCQSCDDEKSRRQAAQTKANSEAAPRAASSDPA